MPCLHSIGGGCGFELIILFGPTIPIIAIIMLNIFYWNVRGAGRKSLQNAVKDHCRVHDISICVMVEPRISGDNSLKVLKSLGFPKFERVDAAMGFSGGIWVLWDDMRCKLEVVDCF